MSPINEPSPPQTMCASGAYTMGLLKVMNRAIAPNFMRPATEPVMMAHVIMQNAIWNPISIIAGYVAPSGAFAASESMLAVAEKHPI